MRWIPFIIFLLTLVRCANVIPPEGGPRDTIPPILLRSIPENNSKNFNGDKLTLEFDEWIQLRNAKEEVIITPSMGKDTKFTYKKNIVTITPQNPLDTATTYSIAFREVIQDLNEGNAAEGLKLAFSTGPIIDSLKIYGRVYSLLEGSDLERFSVAIYSSDTFDITKHQPAYISRTDKKGRFTLSNLKAGSYFIYTWEDKNKNLKVETNSERFGTIPSAISLPINKDSVRIPVVKIDSRPLKLNNYRNISNYTIIRLNKAPNNYNISSKAYVRSHFGSSANEIIAYPPLTHPDSTEIRITAQDSLQNRIDSVFFIKQTKSKPIKELFEAKVQGAKYTASTKTLKAEINYSLPIQTIFADSIEVRMDTIPFTRMNIKDLEIDSIRKKISIQKSLIIPDSLLTKSPNIILESGAIISIFSDTLKTLEQKIVPRIDKDLATVTLIAKTKKENWIVEAVDEQFVVLQTHAHNKTVTFKGLDPISTKFRAFYDKNNNGKWDINNPLKKEPPEEYIYYKNEKGLSSVPLRANWAVELEWNF